MEDTIKRVTKPIIDSVAHNKSDINSDLKTLQVKLMNDMQNLEMRQTDEKGLISELVQSLR